MMHIVSNRLFGDIPACLESELFTSACEVLRLSDMENPEHLTHQNLWPPTSHRRYIERTDMARHSVRINQASSCPSCREPPWDQLPWNISISTKKISFSMLAVCLAWQISPNLMDFRDAFHQVGLLIVMTAKMTMTTIMRMQITDNHRKPPR